MSRLLLLLAVLAGLGLSSCQCSDKPDIGPVEDAGTASLVTQADTLLPA